MRHSPFTIDHPPSTLPFRRPMSGIVDKMRGPAHGGASLRWNFVGPMPTNAFPLDERPPAPTRAIGSIDPRKLDRLVQTCQELSRTRDMGRLMEVVRRAAREITGADGATFILRDHRLDGDYCYYADE